MTQEKSNSQQPEEINEEEKKKLAIEFQELTTWFTIHKNKDHPERKEKLARFQSLSKKLSNFKKKNKGKAISNITEIFREALLPSIFLRAAKELKSREQGNAPMIISLLTKEEEEAIEKYPEVQKKLTSLISKVREFYKTLDSVMMETEGDLEPAQYHAAVNFNRKVVGMKRELDAILK